MPYFLYVPIALIAVLAMAICSQLSNCVKGFSYEDESVVSVSYIPQKHGEYLDNSFITASDLNKQGNITNGNYTLEIETDCGSIIYEDKPIKASDFLVAEQIYQRKINAPLEQKAELVDECLSRGADLKLAISVCFPLLDNAVKSAIALVHESAVDSTLSFDKNKRDFVITNSKCGSTIDEAMAYRRIYRAIKSGERHVKLDTVVVNPKITEADNLLATVLRSSYTTNFAYSTNERKSNIALALSAVDGYTVNQGESISFNNLVGARSTERGYKTAKIIVGGKYVDGVGGGVCQASTALYNAALLAGLKATARNHSILPSYVEPSFDAMVNSCSADLVIENTTAYPITIVCDCSDDTATVSIYGLKLNSRITREFEIIKTQTAQDVEIIDTDYKYFDRQTAVSGTKLRVSYPHDGLVSKGYLITCENNTITKELISTNVYYATNGIVAVAP